MAIEARGMVSPDLGKQLHDAVMGFSQGALARAELPLSLPWEKMTLSSPDGKEKLSIGQHPDNSSLNISVGHSAMDCFHTHASILADDQVTARKYDSLTMRDKGEIYGDQVAEELIGKIGACTNEQVKIIFLSPKQ